MNKKKNIDDVIPADEVEEVVVNEVTETELIDDVKDYGQLKKENVELEGDLKRIQADFVNYRNRTDEEKLAMLGSGKAHAIRELMPSLDSLHRAMSMVPDDLADHEYMTGLQGVAKQLLDAMNKLGLIKVDTVGQIFDPETMEAVSMEDEGGEEEVVVEELQAGFMLGEELLRPAMVKVKK